MFLQEKEKRECVGEEDLGGGVVKGFKNNSFYKIKMSYIIILFVVCHVTGECITLSLFVLIIIKKMPK